MCATYPIYICPVGELDTALQPHAHQDEAAEEDAEDSDEVQTHSSSQNIARTCKFCLLSNSSVVTFQEVDQEAMEEVLGVQLDKDEEDDEDEQEGLFAVLRPICEL